MRCMCILRSSCCKVTNMFLTTCVWLWRASFSHFTVHSAEYFVVSFTNCFLWIALHDAGTLYERWIEDIKSLRICEGSLILLVFVVACLNNGLCYEKSNSGQPNASCSSSCNRMLRIWEKRLPYIAPEPQRSSQFHKITVSRRSSQRTNGLY